MRVDTQGKPNVKLINRIDVLAESDIVARNSWCAFATPRNCYTNNSQHMELLATYNNGIAYHSVYGWR